MDRSRTITAPRWHFSDSSSSVDRRGRGAGRDNVGFCATAGRKAPILAFLAAGLDHALHCRLNYMLQLCALCVLVRRSRQPPRQLPVLQLLDKSAVSADCRPVQLTVIDAHIADVWVCEHHKLALVAGVSHDLLVTCTQQHSTHQSTSWSAYSL